MQTKVLILPGFGNSADEHWQSLWEDAHPDFIRVQQRDWEHPICEEWVGALEEALVRAGTDVILVAHSMACLVVAHIAQKKYRSIRGAFLVAPPDATSPYFPSSAVGFEKTPLHAFDFPSMMIASTNDKYATLAYAKKLARSWGSAFVNIGAKGHINALSDLGFWDEGWTLFQTFQNQIKAKGVNDEKYV